MASTLSDNNYNLREPGWLSTIPAAVIGIGCGLLICAALLALVYLMQVGYL